MAGSVAQWIERLPPEQKVASSSLVGITLKHNAFEKPGEASINGK